MPSHPDKGKGRALPQPEHLSPHLGLEPGIQPVLSHPVIGISPCTSFNTDLFIVVRAPSAGPSSIVAFNPDAVLDPDFVDGTSQLDGDVEEMDMFGERLFPPPRRRAATPAPTVPKTITIVLHLRIGQPLTHTRLRKWLPGPSAILYAWNDDDYDFLCLKIKRRVATIPEAVEWAQGSHLYLQPHNTATANQYVQLDSSNCNSELRAAWLKEFRRTKRSDIVCNVYVYLKDNQVAGMGPIAATGSNSATAVRPRGQLAAPAFRRATQGRIMEQAARITEQPDLQHLGPITSAHLARTMARRPQSNAPIEVPRTATFRQMQHLDEQSSHLHQRQAQETDERQQELKPFQIEVAGIPVRIWMSVSALRTFLELPDMSLNGVANFQEAEINGPQEDIEDVDHAVSEDEL